LDVVVAASGFGRKEMQVLQDVSRFVHEGIFIVTSFLSI
jgi:L-asparaginase/Glu-tRNA(Gln) amidotransferase subunit D